MAPQKRSDIKKRADKWQEEKLQKQLSMMGERKERFCIGRAGGLRAPGGFVIVCKQELDRYLAGLARDENQAPAG